MPRGRLEVVVVGAKGLENSDFLCNMDPYLIIKCRTQEQKSSVAQGQGTTPQWNETFVFNVSKGVSEITIKIMDKDSGSSDDFVGEATISLEALFEEGSIPPQSYNVVKDQTYHGEIKVGLTFSPSEDDCEEQDRSYGGWKESSYGY